MIVRTYNELKQLKTFEERFEYLRLDGFVGRSTFGFDRIFNQKFYSSIEWARIRDQVIIRDNCCDLGVAGFDIREQRICIHHLNPITLDDIEKRTELLLDPRYLITTTHNTHNAIHYGNAEGLLLPPIDRCANDTCPWKR